MTSSTTGVTEKNGTSAKKRRKTPIVTIVQAFPRRPLAITIALSVIGALGEALLLILLVNMAGSVSKTSNARVGFGPLDLSHLSKGGLVLFAVVAGVTTLLFQIAAVYVMTESAATVLKRRRAQLFARFLHAGWHVQQEEEAGRLQEVLSQHLMRAAEGVLVTGTVVAALVNFMVLIASAFVVNPVAASLMMGLIIVLAGMLRPLSRKAGNFATAWAWAGNRYAKTVSTFVRLTLEARTFAVQPRIQELADQDSDIVAGAYRRSRRLQRTTPTAFRVSVLLIAVVAVAIASAAAPSEIGSLGAMVLIVVRALSYVQTVQQSLQIVSEMTSFDEAAREIEERYVSDDVKSGTERLGMVGKVAFEGVSYSYTPDGVKQLKQVSFALERGQSLAIVGPSGSGKSTLVQLLLRLRSPLEGRFLVNGDPVDAYSIASWYERVALLPQETRLIPGTIADNIRFLRGDAEGLQRGGFTGSQVEQAARRAHLLDDVVALPDGLQTNVGEEGRSLSGGQRQRVGLARCLLGEPDLLVLDEPTSALDAASEAAIFRTLEEIKASTALLVITHRLQMLELFDQVLVLTGGQVEAYGTVDDVLGRSMFLQTAAVEAD